MNETHAGADSKKRKREVSDVRATQRKKDLEHLKKQWLTLGKGGENYEAALELSKESARLLLASQESVDLIVFLSEHKIGNGISDRIQDLFSSSQAADARITLLGLPDGQSGDGTNYREEWSAKAGMGCSEAEFEAFHAALGGGPCAQEALLGHYQARVTVEPVETVRATIDELGKKMDSMSSVSIYSKLMDRLPDSAPFGEIEEMLPKADHARAMLFKKWAAVDRQGAFDHLMANSGRLNPELIVPITQAFMKGDMWAGFEWVQKMPDGPHFDTAARVVINSLRTMYPDQARQVADQITDPVEREKAYERISAPYEEGQPRK
ncbi:MAG: hypothetical protein V4689_11965 [Verrucomicrobiota bacterium]